MFYQRLHHVSWLKFGSLYRESLQAMSIKQLKEYLKRKHISTVGFLEKQEFIDAVKRTL